MVKEEENDQEDVVVSTENGKKEATMNQDDTRDERGEK